MGRLGQVDLYSLAILVQREAVRDHGGKIDVPGAQFSGDQRGPAGPELGDLDQESIESCISTTGTSGDGVDS